MNFVIIFLSINCLQSHSGHPHLTTQSALDKRKRKIVWNGINNNY
jgi:hypothetical protein